MPRTCLVVYVGPVTSEMDTVLPWAGEGAGGGGAVVCM